MIKGQYFLEDGETEHLWLRRPIHGIGRVGRSTTPRTSCFPRENHPTNGLTKERCNANEDSFNLEVITNPASKHNKITPLFLVAQSTRTPTTRDVNRDPGKVATFFSKQNTRTRSE